MNSIKDKEKLNKNKEDLLQKDLGEINAFIQKQQDSQNFLNNIKIMYVDSHQHFWDIGKFSYPWMSGVPQLKRNFLPQDLKPHLDSCGIGKSIIVQADTSVEETIWLLEIADNHDFIAGVVVLIPIGITVYLTLFLVSISSGILPKEINPNHYLPYSIPGLEILLAIIFITIIGSLSLSFIGKKILKIFKMLIFLIAD